MTELQAAEGRSGKEAGVTEIETPLAPIYLGGRGIGKTTRCIQQAAETDAYIVCHTRKMAHEVMVLAGRTGYPDIRFPITYREFFTGQFCGRGCKGFILDDLDHALQASARGVPIELVTWTGEE